MQTLSIKNLLPLGTVAVAGLVLGLVLAGGLSLTPSSHAERTPAPAASTPAPPAGCPDFAALADRVLPAVISVLTEDRRPSAERNRGRGQVDPFEFFFGVPRQSPPDGRTPRRRGAGSGFFVSADGLALTNNHVIDGADKITVSMADDTELEATVVGRDPATDLALIRVKGNGPFAFLPLGDSDALRVGEWVMAAGNPRRLSHTITVGVVSAKGRSIGLSAETRSFENFIQTDAAINLGNSGGPLVNLRGEVIGVNTAIDAGGQNIGFAVPVSTVVSVLDQLRETGRVVRGFLGVRVRNLDDEAREAFGLSTRSGALVSDVDAGGPADKAGLRRGDVVVAIGGKPVQETRQLIDQISGLAPGTKVEVEIIRGGKPQKLSATLGERPASGEETPTPGGEKESSPAGKLGLQIEEITPQLRRTFGLKPDLDGVVITDVTDLSPADDKGLRPGDVILQVNGEEVSSAASFRKALGAPKSGQLVRLYVFRPRAEQQDFVFLRVP
jgi:serine protease Do